MSVAAPLVLREGDRSRLEALTRSGSIRAGLVLRARIVLLAAEGLPNAEIERRTGTSRPTVVDWRARYDAGAICASLRRRLTGYHDATPDTLQRRFLSTTGVVHNDGDTITVRLNRRTYSPVLRQTAIPDTVVPWWGGRRLHFEYD